MCHEMWIRRRREQEEREGREVWLDFERTRPVADPGTPSERPEEVRASEPGEALTAER